jgi:putative membrane protein
MNYQPPSRLSDSYPWYNNWASKIKLLIKIDIRKKLALVSGLVACIYLFPACNNGGSEPKDSVDSAKNVNDSTRKATDTSSATPTVTAQPVDKACTDFAVKAASGGMMEVQLGKLAQDKAVNPRVKNFGAMMVADHSKANDDLMARAKSQNITLPAMVGSDEQKMMDNLAKKTGKDFDKAYMDMMLKDHKKDIAEFKTAAEKSTNPTIKDFASSTLPTLEKHLDSVNAILGKK